MYVIELAPGEFERAVGNPVITSLDGEVVAPLVVVLHETWTDGDRAKFGVFAVEPFVVPEGHRKVGDASYIRLPDGTIKELYATEPIPAKPVLTTAEKLARIGLTIEELKAALT